MLRRSVANATSRAGFGARPISPRHPRSAALGADARFSEIAVPQGEGDAQRTTCISGGRLNPDLLERTFAEETAVADTIQGDAPRQAQPLNTQGTGT